MPVQVKVTPNPSQILAAYFGVKPMACRQFSSVMFAVALAASAPLASTYTTANVGQGCCNMQHSNYRYVGLQAFLMCSF